ncbi:nuclear transport factor 2 family protein [Sphingobium lactosutens]|uniref:nuclear transport factor 2 family protein n=1 Tax=Sphingobium lactosutens TaxID=522773 RepID=UPI0015B845AB|nr:nuclear transport factor 2 family protein [Sphingobium lactosutens]NWK98268.1 nuclear transport factor 2 family protein [Sphingobium lactosutens]
MADAVKSLLAIEEIKRLKARYFRLMDTKDWAGFSELFTEDAIFDVGGALEENPGPDQEPIVGRAAIVDYVSSGIGPITSAHYGHMPEIEILSEDSATGIWALADILRMPAGAPFARFYGYGHYHENYRRVEGGWKIASLRISRLLVETY